MTSLDSPSILRHFCYWLFHCSLNAAPSFFIAVAWINLTEPVAISAMLAAVLTFVLLYTAFTSLMQRMKFHPTLSRALRVGVIVRVFVSIGSLISALASPFVSPDLLAGLVSIGIYGEIARNLGLPAWQPTNPGADSHFLTVYSVTMIEGFLLSFTLFLFSFFAVLFIQAKERKKSLRHQNIALKIPINKAVPLMHQQR